MRSDFAFYVLAISLIFFVSATHCVMRADAGEYSRAVTMPPLIVLITCRVEFIEPSNDVEAHNQKMTGYRKTRWLTVGSKLQCKRQLVTMHDASDRPWAPSVPFNVNRCQRAGVMLGASHDHAAADRPWRTWRVACPTPLMNTITGEFIAWKYPPCGNRDTVDCDGDSAV